MNRLVQTEEATAELYNDTNSKNPLLKSFYVLPIALKEDPSMWEAISVRLLELMAYASDVMEDMLDMDMVSNFISAAMLPKELDSIMDDIIACWAEEEEKEDDSSIVCISFFIIMDELMDDDDSL